MRTMFALAAALPMLAGCYHTTVAPMTDGQQRVTFYDDSPPPLGWTSPILAEDAALWTAGGTCPAGFKVTQESMNMGNYPHSYSIDVRCNTDAVAVRSVAPPAAHP